MLRARSLALVLLLAGVASACSNGAVALYPPDAATPADGGTAPDSGAVAALPTCERSSDLIMSMLFAATVEASGALTYHHNSAGGESPSTMAEGTLTAVDVEAYPTHAGGALTS